MHDSTLTSLIASDAALRTRIDALVRKRVATATLTPTEWAMVDRLPVAEVARAVANNPTVFTTVKGALDPAAPDVAAAVDTVADGDLDYIVATELTMLA